MLVVSQGELQAANDRLGSELRDKVWRAKEVL